MGMILEGGGLVARRARTTDMARVMALREACFGPAGGPDRFDPAFRHLLVEDEAGRPLCTLRWQVLAPGDLPRAACAESYDLAPLATRPGPSMEIGRFCTAPGARDGAALRLALAALTRLVVAGRVARLFGSASLAGADPERHAPALAWLAAHHRATLDAPPAWHAAETVPLVGAAPDRAGLPPLLRAYLDLGAQVGDHAVIDRAMDTLHVLCLLEVEAIPPRRARALRALAFGT
ncbi:putative hemolysin [Limimaricola variabilis]|uniref:Hemolysin n=1 Tax=Limimaricola variabilis TaxID=1492771 RepID=A0ABR6HJ62_9RHOB|nr:GNAT family N-acyltransferase [Limimaricola variabilis]MBB3710601.1 putative hemolysin [Limimaricola variabilis]